MARIYTLNILLSLMLFMSAKGESRFPIGFSYWDVGQFYDTIPSMFYDDGDYTPQGRKSWNTLRYRRKVERIAEVVDSMRMPIVALFGVESEGVVRDIVSAVKLDYSYLHRTLDGRDGLDFALLYFGDLLLVDYVESFYGRLYIEGEIDSRRVGFWLTRYGYLQRSAAPPHRDSVDVMIIAGGMYRGDLEKIEFVDQMSPHESRGRGDAMSYRGWYMSHRIGTPSDVDISHSGVYIKPWLLMGDYTAPMPTFSKKGYVGGYSSYLPIFIYFEL